MNDHIVEYGENVRDVFGPRAILSEMNSEWRITYVNERLAEVSRYSKEELLGKVDTVVIHSGAPNKMSSKIREVIASGKIFTGVIQEQTKDGIDFWVDATIVPVKNESGHIVKYISARYLITDDLMAEYLFNKQVEKLALITGA